MSLIKRLFKRRSIEEKLENGFGVLGASLVNIKDSLDKIMEEEGRCSIVYNYLSNLKKGVSNRIFSIFIGLASIALWGSLGTLAYDSYKKQNEEEIYRLRGYIYGRYIEQTTENVTPTNIQEVQRKTDKIDFDYDGKPDLGIVSSNQDIYAWLSSKNTGDPLIRETNKWSYLGNLGEMREKFGFR